MPHIWQIFEPTALAHHTTSRYLVRTTHGYPGELELAKQYGVSRDTTRRAIQELVSANRLVVLYGRGT